MNNGRGFAVAKLCAEKPERCDGFGFAGYSTRALFLCANNAKAKVFAGNSTVYLEPDDAVFIAPFESYAVKQTTGTGSFYCIELPVDFAANDTDMQFLLTCFLPTALSHRSDFRYYGQHTKSGRSLKETYTKLLIAAENKNLLSLFKGQTLCNELWHLLLEDLDAKTHFPSKACCPDAVVKTALSVLNNPITAPHGSEFAKQFGYSYTYFSNIFKKAMGIGFKRYVTLRRIEESKRLLICDDCDIAEVAFRVGYDSKSHFINVFKAQTGFTPKQYRTTVIELTKSKPVTTDSRKKGNTP